MSLIHNEVVISNSPLPDDKALSCPKRVQLKNKSQSLFGLQNVNRVITRMSRVLNRMEEQIIFNQKVIKCIRLGAGKCVKGLLHLVSRYVLSEIGQGCEMMMSC